MELVIRSAENIDRDFVLFLINKIIPGRFISMINPQKLKKWDEFLFKSNLSGFNLGSIKTTEQLLKYAIQNLTFSSYGGDFTISLDATKTIQGTNTKISAVCRLINYGNTEISGLGIFSDVFNKVRKELELYKNMYTMGIR
jgi:hypothetical protein